MPWRLGPSIEMIKDYHGEKIGLYFRFLAKYSTWLFAASFMGVLAFACIALEESGTWGRLGSYRTHGSSIAVPFFACFVLLWSTAFLEDWKRTQVKTAMAWGMRGFEKQEKERPEFLENSENLIINSPIDGRKMIYFPEAKRAQRQRLSYVVIAFFMMLVVCGILAVFIFKAVTDPNQCVTEIVQDDDFDDRTGFVRGVEYGKPTIRCAGGDWSNFRVGPYYVAGLSVPEIPLGTIIAVAINSINIMVFNAIYTVVAKKLNDSENYRTDTDVSCGVCAVARFEIHAFTSFCSNSTKMRLSQKHLPSRWSTRTAPSRT